MRFLLMMSLVMIVGTPAWAWWDWGKSLETERKRIVAEAREVAVTAGGRKQVSPHDPGASDEVVTRESIAKTFGFQVPANLQVHPRVWWIFPSGEPLGYCRIAQGKLAAARRTYESWHATGEVFSTHKVTYANAIDLLVKHPEKPLVGVVRLYFSGSATSHSPFQLELNVYAGQNYSDFGERAAIAIMATPSCPRMSAER